MAWRSRNPQTQTDTERGESADTEPAASTSIEDQGINSPTAFTSFVLWVITHAFCILGPVALVYEYTRLFGRDPDSILLQPWSDNFTGSDRAKILLVFLWALSSTIILWISHFNDSGYFWNKHKLLSSLAFMYGSVLTLLLMFFTAYMIHLYVAMAIPLGMFYAGWFAETCTRWSELMFRLIRRKDGH